MKGSKCKITNGQILKSGNLLKDEVTSPAGTTIAALDVLEKNGLRSTVMKVRPKIYCPPSCGQLFELAANVGAYVLRPSRRRL